jgi:hypothetical protein
VSVIYAFVGLPVQRVYADLEMANAEFQKITGRAPGPGDVVSVEVIRPVADDIIRKVLEQRDEITRAFVAKYGCSADEAVQVQEPTPDGGMRWYVERREAKK